MSRILWVIGGILILGLFVGSVGESRDPGATASSAPVYVEAGWTIDRLVDLEFEFRDMDGMSDQLAECVSRIISGGVPLREWEALSTAGEIEVVATAKQGCQAETTR